jgi:hypothetical protein
VACGLVTVLFMVLLCAAPTGAAIRDVGHMDNSYVGAGAAPTGGKPQSKLWFHDGTWWADMFDVVSQTWHIFRLDGVSQVWVDTHVQIDDRPSTRGDLLWDGVHLYVASNALARSASENVAGQAARLYRYSYSTTGHRYVLDAGFPVAMSDVSSESLILDKDSRGVLWATWTQGEMVYVNSTDGDDAVWGKPFVPEVPGARRLYHDDLSSVAAFGGSRVALMWSNQLTSAFYVAVHRDGDPRNRWTLRTSWAQPGIADDHISLKQVQGDGRGQVFAAVKTSMDKMRSRNAPQTLLLRVDLDANSWTTAVFGTVADCHTRPMLVIDRVNRVAHMLATAPSAGGCPHSGTPGTIYEKTTSLDHLAFPPGRGTPVVRDVESADMNNVTSTKQTVTPDSGLVLLASDDASRRYWHADLSIPDPRGAQAHG